MWYLGLKLTEKGISGLEQGAGDFAVFTPGKKYLKGTPIKAAYLTIPSTRFLSTITRTCGLVPTPAFQNMMWVGTNSSTTMSSTVCRKASSILAPLCITKWVDICAWEERLA